MVHRVAYAVETQHFDPKIGWVLLRVFTTRADAWESMRKFRSQWPSDVKCRTVRYVPDRGGK